MKNYLIIFSLLSVSNFIFSQNSETIITNEYGDTVEYKVISFYQNGKIAQIRYLTEHRNRKNTGKIDLFMMGATKRKTEHFSILDSIETHYYDEDWLLDKVESSKTEEQSPVINIQNTEFQFKENFIHISGKKKSTVIYELELTNNTTQPKHISFGSYKFFLGKGSKILLNPLETKKIPIELNIENGIERIRIEASDQEYNTAETSLEIIGYDLTNSDFEETENTEKIISIGGNRITVKTDGIEKLLKIHLKKGKTVNIPISESLKIIDTTNFQKGKVLLLEIIDLGSNRSKYSKVIIRK